MKCVRNHHFFVLCTFITALAFACVVGCPQKTKQPPGRPSVGGGKGVGTNEQIFSQVIDSFNHLENHFGQESFTHIVARLNSWFTDQSPDPSWQEDAFFVEQEKSLSVLAENFTQFAKSLEKIIVPDHQSDSSPLTPDDVQNAANLAKTLMEQLAVTQETLGVPQLLGFQQRVGEIESILGPLANVAKSRDMSEDAIREFFQSRFRQLGDNMIQLVYYFHGQADIISHFAESFRGRTLDFSRLDGDYLKQAFWCRSVAHWACGNRQEEIELAKELFDWTIRNIMLQTVPLPQGQMFPMVPQNPWETLLFGKGSTSDWAYLFVEFLRQHRIDACLFVSNFQDSQGQIARLPWGAGVLIDGKVHVFLVRYGVPLVITEDEITLVPDKGLVFGRVATFDQLQDNLELLLPYLGEKFSTDQVRILLEQTSLVIPADPIAQSQRMLLLEKALTGANKTVLFTSFPELKQRFENAVPGATVARWNYPFAANFQSCLTRNVPDMRMELFRLAANPEYPYPLWKGRILYFSGRKTGQGAAATELQNASISEQERLSLMDKSAVAMAERGTQLDLQIRETETALLGVSEEDKPGLQMLLQELLQLRNEFASQIGMNFQGLQFQSAMYEIVGGTANYWLGQIHFEEALLATNASNRKGSLSAAYDYVNKRIINNFKPHLQQWRLGANYHMGRVCEMQGKYEEAIRFYSMTSPEPDSVGRLFRARQLQRLAPKE